MSMNNLLITCCVTTALYFVLRWFQRWLFGFYGIPCPPGFPLLGNALQLRYSTRRELIRAWSERYGPVFRFRILWTNTVVLNSYEALKERLEKSGDFLTIPRVKNELNFGPPGWSLVGEDACVLWDKTLSYMRGTPSSYVEGIEGFEEYMVSISDHLGRVIQPEGTYKKDCYETVQKTVAAIIATLVRGRCVPVNDEFTSLVNNAAYLNQQPFTDSVLVATVLTRIPWLQCFKTKAYKVKLEAWCNNEISWNHFISPLLNESSETGSNALINDLLKLSSESVKPASAAEQMQFSTNVAIRAVISEMLSEGVSTLTSALYGVQQVLLLYPRIQEKIVEESETVRAKLQRELRTTDKKMYPYAEAVAFELLRHSCFTSLGSLSRTVNPTEVEGFHVPAGTQVMSNVWALNHSSVYWNEPWQFKPERFLDNNGRLVPSNHPSRERLSLSMRTLSWPEELYIDVIAFLIVRVLS